jgi:hypothetical protein
MSVENGPYTPNRRLRRQRRRSHRDVDNVRFGSKAVLNRTDLGCLLPAELRTFLGVWSIRELGQRLPLQLQ